MILLTILCLAAWLLVAAAAFVDVKKLNKWEAGQ